MHYVTFDQIRLAPSCVEAGYGKLWFIETKKGYCLGIIMWHENFVEKIYAALNKHNPVHESLVF